MSVHPCICLLNLLLFQHLQGPSWADQLQPQLISVTLFQRLQRSLDMAAQLKGNLWLLGDFNYPKFSWDQEHMPTMKSGTGFPAPYEDFVSLLDDFSLVQMVNEPTRGENVLGLYLTSNHTLVNDISILPGIADHDIVVANVSTKPKVSKQIPRKIPLFKRANWTGFQSYMAEKNQKS